MKRKPSPWSHLLKGSLLALAFYLIIDRISWGELRSLEVSLSSPAILLLVVSFLLLHALNLGLDAFAWQKVQGLIYPKTWWRALQDNLKCYGLAFVTPLNSGELAGRYLVQDKPEHRKMTLYLTFWNHIPRLLAKIALAFPLAFLLLESTPWKPYRWWLILIYLPLITAYFFLEKIITAVQAWQIGRFELHNYLLGGRPTRREKLLLLSINALRFLCFSGQLALVIYLFTPQVIDRYTLASIPVFYFITAVVPTWAAFDFIIKGAISLYFFGLFSDQELVFAVSSSLVWITNLGLPALIGLGQIDWAAVARFRKRKN